MVIGYPASGKTTVSQEFITKGYTFLNRDTEGGSVQDLIPKFKRCVASGENVVLDNLFATVKSRQAFLDVAKKLGATVRCIWVATTLEDAQINALHRMYKRHGKIFYTANDLKSVSSDPNMFPVAVLFKYRKEFEKPTMSEGFVSVEKVDFVRKSNGYTNKAAIFDYDGTLRDSKGKYKFPVTPEDIVILPGRKEKLKQLAAEGYLLLGISNQSGIAKGNLTEEAAVECFKKTNEMLGVDIDFVFCPHGVPPSCYCRKPQSGLGVALIEKHKIDVIKSFYVGDQTTDRTFAERLGLKFFEQGQFFR